MDFDEFDDDFAEFDTPVEQETVEDIVVNPKVEVIEEIEENIEVKTWLLTTLIIVIVLHSFSDKWINWIVSLSHSIDPVTTRLLDDIKNMKEELKSVSQVDDFAKYSKLERKILKARQELENSKGGSNTSRLQTKVAIVSFWRMLGVSFEFLYDFLYFLKNKFILGNNYDVHNVELWFDATLEVPESILVSIRVDDFNANRSV